MKKNKKINNSFINRKRLLYQVEKLVGKEGLIFPEELDEISKEKIQELYYELKIHQIELEMQNEELKRIQEELNITKDRYYDLYDLAPEGYLIVSEKGLILESNLTASVIFNADRQYLHKRRFSQFIFKEDQGIYFNHRKILLETGIHQKFEIRMLRKDGTVFWGQITSNTSINEGDLCSNIVLSDISKRKKIESELIESEEKFRRLISYMDQGLALHEVVFNDDGRVIDYIFIDINESYENIIGKEREKIIGKSIREVMPDIDGHWISVFGNVALTGESTYCENYIQSPERYYSSYAYCPKKNQFAILVSDITERVENENRIFYLNYHDQLTGVYNRRFYEEELKRLDTKRNLPLTVVMGDVNGLKLVNDSFGHVIGDKLLVRVAELIRKGCRSDDIIARLGGDEFVILLPNADAEETNKIIGRIRDFLEGEKIMDIDISISFGYETKHSIDEDIEEVFKSAEENMYRHKLSESTKMKSKTIELIINTLYEKNHKEKYHSQRVSELCEAIAKKIGLQEEKVYQMKIAGLLHDVGKFGISEKILNNNKKYSSDEIKEIQRHSEIGYRILSSANEFSEIAIFVLEHHERWDGKGYPRGLKNTEISLESRIISIADTYDSLINTRHYAKVFSKAEAIEEIKKCSGKQFDPEIVKIFIEEVLESV